MKYVALIFVSMICFGCSTKSGDTAKRESSTVKREIKSPDQVKADSLKAVGDSIMEIKRLHSLTQGSHIHNANSDLAAVAHQDPKRTKRMTDALQKNEPTRQKIIDQQNQRMHELLMRKRALATDSSVTVYK